MTALGFVNIAHQFSWDAALPFTLAELVFGLAIAILVHLFLAFPSGRLGSRFERWFVVFTYAAWLVLSLVGSCSGIPRERRVPGMPAQPAPGRPEPGRLERGRRRSVTSSRSAILLTTAVLLVRRVRRATRPDPPRARPRPRSRRPSRFLLSARSCSRMPPVAKAEGSVVCWVGNVAFAIIPVAFLVGLLRTRMHRSAVAGLVVELGSLPRPAQVRDAIARTLGDPSLELAFWLPERRALRRPRREPLDLAKPSRTAPSRCSSTTGKRLAALVHDPALLDDPELVEAVGAAATLALENARLQAELRAQLAEVRASRARIVEAGDAERRRLERDLHDGAQQRLLGIRLALQLARSRLADGGAAVDELLAEADAEVVDALAELRALARGIHPAILTEEGLPAALAALARRAPVPVELTVCTDRLPAPVEATAYFVTAEALANVAKHAHASAGDGRQSRARTADWPSRSSTTASAAQTSPAPGCAASATASKRSTATCASRPARRRHAPHSGDPVRVILADDAVVVREGLARLLAEHDVQIAGQAGTAEELLRSSPPTRPTSP